MIKSATGQSATESPKVSEPIAPRLRRPSCCLVHSFRCCFRVKNGPRVRLSFTSPITATGTWPDRFQKGAKENSLPSVGILRQSQIQKAMQTFERSKMNWNELEQPLHAEMLDWYRKLIQLRRTTPSLNNGEPGNSNVTFSEEQRWLRVIRGRIVIACNLSQTPHYCRWIRRPIWCFHRNRMLSPKSAGSPCRLTRLLSSRSGER